MGAVFLGFFILTVKGVSNRSENLTNRKLCFFCIETVFKKNSTSKKNRWKISKQNVWKSWDFSVQGGTSIIIVATICWSIFEISDKPTIIYTGSIVFYTPKILYIVFLLTLELVARRRRFFAFLHLLTQFPL